VVQLPVHIATIINGVEISFAFDGLKTFIIRASTEREISHGRVS
jgi:hypothetical protein